MFRSIAVFAATVSVCHAQSIPQQVDAAIGSYFSADAPGASIIVVRDGTVVLRKGYGMADVAKGIPMSGAEQHRIGSVTKQFTSTAILMLIDEGKLALSDPITKYLPDYPVKGKMITIEHLLTHTAGVANFTSKKDFSSTMAKEMSVAAMIDTFKDDPLGFEPGSAHAYSNSGYFLLGAIIEKTSGMRYADFVRQRIFVPLDMRNTAVEGHATGDAPRAVPHTTTPAGYGPAKMISMTQPFAAGAIVSTLDDLAKWNEAVSSGKLLRAPTWKQAFTPHKLPDGKDTGYGYGWRIDTMHGSPRISHGGGVPGHSAFVMHMPNEKLFIAVLANSDKHPFSTQTIANRAAAVVLGKQLEAAAP